MIRHFLLLVLALASLPALATDSYGYIRVQVGQNPPAPKDHIWPMSLEANGRTIGTPFAHSSQGFGWTALSLKHLNSTGARTPISAYYGSIGANECDFDFEIFFSFTPNGTGISLGVFHAPTSASAGSIPIGLRCKNSSGEVCSDDPKFRDKLIEMQTRARVDDYNRWKREYDERLRQEFNELATRQAEVDSALESANSVEAEAETAESETAESALDELQEQNEAAKKAELEALKNAPVDETTSPELLAENAEPAINEAARERFYQSIDTHRDELVKTGLGAFVFGWVELNRMMDELIEDQRAFSKWLREEDSAAEALFEANTIAAQMEWAKYTLSKSGPVATALKDGVKLVANDFVDACEAITGREYCMDRPLSPYERTKAVFSLLWGNRDLFNKAEKTFEETIKKKATDTAKTLYKINTKLADGPYVAELILNEYVDGDGRIVSSVLKKMHAGDLAVKPLTLSLEDGNRVIMRPTGKAAAQWSLEFQGRDSQGNYETRHQVELTLDSDGRVVLIE